MTRIDGIRVTGPHPFRAARRRRGDGDAMASLRFFLTAYAGGLAFFVALLL